MKTYSLEFKKNVLSVKEKEGLDFKETAERFGIPKINVYRWFRDTSDFIVTRRMSEELLIKNITEYPNISQRARAKMLFVKQPTISYWIKKITKINICPTCGAKKRVLDEGR